MGDQGDEVRKQERHMVIHPPDNQGHTRRSMVIPDTRVLLLDMLTGSVASISCFRVSGRTNVYIDTQKVQCKEAGSVRKP